MNTTPTPTLTYGSTERGFPLVEFTDIGNAACPEMARVLIAANPIKEPAAETVRKMWQPMLMQSREERFAGMAV